MLRKSVALLALCLFVAGCNGFPLPAERPDVDSEEIEAMAALLPPQQAKELRVHYDEHDEVWNLDVHSKDTCPIITFTPAYYRYENGQMTDLEWAEFLHEFFEDKHKEEGHCDCDERLGGQ